MNRGHAVKVAAVTTAAIAALYVICVLVLNVLVSAHLIEQNDDHLSNRLTALQTHPADLRQQLSSPGTQPGAVYDDAAPVAEWLLSDGRVVAHTPDAPALPASLIAGGRAGQSVTQPLSGAGDWRLVTAETGEGILVAGQSISGDQRLEHWMLLGEITAGPVLLLAMFAVSALIGLRAQAPVEQARQRQLEFTADASHELRTPLSVIRAETELALATPRTPAGDHDALRRIWRESSRLHQLTENMLWLARFDSQPPRQKEGPVDLVTVARSCADRFRSIGPSVTCDTPVDAALIVAPPEWIDRLAGVLLDNACRYAGPDGKVQVSVAVTGNRATLAVEDSGPGIPQEQRPRLFDRFYRATEEKSGAGLGLAIGNSVVTSTGGRWEVGDSPLGGARLAVTWRCAQS
jgi:signal transduction histidine kinase